MKNLNMKKNPKPQSSMFEKLLRMNGENEEKRDSGIKRLK
jgi:hypothetical protein